MRVFLLLIGLAGGCVPLAAGEFNPVLSVGDAAPAWSDLPGVDGNRHSLAEIDSGMLVLVVFTCNSCPVARDYEDRLIEFTKLHAEQVQVVAINVNLIPEDSFEKMQERAAEREFNFSYLFDESQQIARDFGANGTPEFFLLSTATIGADGQSQPRTLLYQGAMDNNSVVDQVTEHHLEAAVAAALAGEAPVTRETYAHGCRIRFKRMRRE